MKKYNSISVLLIAYLFLSGMIKENRTRVSIPESKWNQTINKPGQLAERPEISIADTRIVEGDAGPRSVEVMVALSLVAFESVTVTYSTKNGTASAGSDYIAVNGSIIFAKGEMMKKIVVPITGDVVCEPDETCEILLNNPSGATLVDNTGTVTIVNDDFKCSGLPGSGKSPGNNLSMYEVRLTFTGYTTFYGGPPDCPIRSNGKVTLAGLVSGNEKVDPDDDIMYRGTLQLDIDMDICSAKRVGGEDQLCGMTVIGSGLVNTELELYFNGLGQDSARGGYIKIENKSGIFFKKVTGSCDIAEMNEEQTMVPDKTIASMFNGYELPMLKNRTLRVGRYVLTGDAGETVVEVLRVVRP